MKQTISIYSNRGSMTITVETENRPANPTEVYQLMSERQKQLADTLFGIPSTKQDLVRAKRLLDRAEDAVEFWHARVHELKAKLLRFSFDDDSELTEHQLRIICDIDRAERMFEHKLQVCGEAYKAVQEAEAAYSIYIDTFKVAPELI